MSKTTRVPLIAAFVCNNPAEFSIEDLHLLFAALVSGVMGGDDLLAPEEVFARGSSLEYNLFVEQPQKQGRISTTNNIITFQTSIFCMESATSMYENAKKWMNEAEADEGAEEDEELQYILCVGSRSFCGAVIHYLAADGEHSGQSWGFYFLRQLLEASSGQIIFTSLEDDDMPLSLAVKDVMSAISKPFRFD